MWWLGEPYAMSWTHTGSAQLIGLGLTGSRGCTETVSKPLRFEALEFCLSEKRTPQAIVFIRSRQNEESV